MVIVNSRIYLNFTLWLQYKVALVKKITNYSKKDFPKSRDNWFECEIFTEKRDFNALVFLLPNIISINSCNNNQTEIKAL